MKTNTDSWYFQNKAHCQEYQRNYRLNNMAKFTAKTVKRAALLKQACPKWITPHMVTDMENVFVLAKATSNFTGVAHNVDHIVPLNSDIVCGLHVPWNLRVTTARFNEQKTNNVVDNDCDIDSTIFKSLNTNEGIYKVTSARKPCKTVVCYETGVEYYSTIECGKKVGASPKDIQRVCKGKTQSVKGFHFYYKSDSYKIEDLKVQWQVGTRRTHLVCVETSQSFYSYKQAAKELGMPVSTLTKNVKSGKPCNGLTLKRGN